MYKVAQTTAPVVTLSQVLPTSGDDAWTAAAMPISSLSSTDNYKITVAAVDALGAAVAAGDATIDVK